MVSSENLPLRTLLDSAPDGFIVADSQGLIVWANQTAHEMFDYRDIELIGRKVEELVPDRLRPTHAAHREGYQNSSRIRPMGLGLNLLGRKKDGAEFPLEISLSPLHTNQGLLVTAVIRDVTERRRLDNERALLELELETERERDRIAMDLHDGVMQDVYAIALTLELALADSPDPAMAAAPSVEKAIDQMHNVVRSIRSYIFDLRPRDFSGALPEALANLAQEFGQNSQISTESDIRFDANLTMARAMGLYQIAHESLSNIQRHAQASHVSLSLTCNDHHGSLEIADDGIGFDTTAQRSEEHRGLRNMFTRANSIEAVVTIDSNPGAGTRLRVDFPLERDSATQS